MKHNPFAHLPISIWLCHDPLMYSSHDKCFCLKVQKPQIVLPYICITTHLITKTSSVKIKKEIDHIFNVLLYFKLEGLTPIAIFIIFLVVHDWSVKIYLPYSRCFYFISGFYRFSNKAPSKKIFLAPRTLAVYRLTFTPCLLTYLLTYILTYLFMDLLTNLITYLFTPWSRVLLVKLTGYKLVKKFPAYYGTRRFITTFTSAHHLSLS